MMRVLLVRGLWVGLVGGLLALVVALVYGEPAVDSAIAYEQQLAHAGGAHTEDAVVSRSMQRTVGLGLAMAVYGLAFGGLFALVFAGVSGRFTRFGPRGTAAVVALLGFVAVVLVPFLTYPANPPGATDDASVGTRTALYLVMVLVSGVALVAAAVLARRLASRYGAWNTTVLAAVAFVVVMAAVAWLLPAVDEAPGGFPAAVLYEFRMATLGMHAVLWATIGLLFGWLTERSVRQRGRSAMMAAS
ncbi:MAG: hypothetical protein GEU83_18515 [Pseudonocardiaceae bacterium]|nr:hypothetical protein [Pseudonocardiaceae bacterium]